VKRIIFLATAIFILFQTGGCATNHEALDDAVASKHATGDIGEEWGIEIVAVRLSAGSYILDFRYRIVDTGKAAPLLDRNVHPYLIDQNSGSRMYVPVSSKLGPMRQTPKNPVAGKTYFIFFANAGGTVQPGDKVTVVIGDFRAEDLVVE
jgi:hypothetical protein